MDSLAIALFLCFILVLAARKLSIPPIPLYIVAGLAAGVSGLNLVQGDTISTYFGHLGLIFLLFSSGLEMKPGRFIAQGSRLILSGLIDLNVNLLLGFLAALALGFDPFDAFVIGSAFFDTSSAISLASLIDNRRLLSSESETIIWLMIIEDLIMVFLIFLVSAEMENPTLLFLKIVSVVVVIGILVRLIRNPLTGVLKRNDDIPILLTFSVVMCASALAIAINIPEAVPLIVLGATLARSGLETLQRITAPFRDVFLVILFFFFGATIPLSAEVSLFAVVAICLLAIVSKMGAGVLIGRLLHHSNESGMEIGIYTIARGEFAVALAAIHGSASVSTMVALMVIITSIAGSLICRYGDRVRSMVR